MESSDNHHQQLGSYGLLRFRSAPSSLPLSADEIDTSRFVNYGGDGSPATVKESPVASPRGYAALPPHYPRPSSGMGSSSAMDGSYYRTAAAAALVSPNPMAAEHQPKSSVSSSLLMRQSSSPPGLFSHLPSHNGYNTMRGTGNSNYRGGSGFSGEITSPPSNRLKGHTSLFSSGQPSSLGILSHMSDLGTDSSSRFPGPGFTFNSWSDSSHFSENFDGLKREEENHHDIKMFNTSLSGEMANRLPMISHRTMSLPRTSSDMAAMEKFLQLQDSVPCKIRAKRGCATHPRSIAERVRRTRISERMRKLQELVPNMDKQTNTADMLDLAVDYIKDLQNEFKMLNESRANCKCMSMQKQ